MLKIQHVFVIKKCLCVAYAQITFICFCVNRYSWWYIKSSKRAIRVRNKSM